jgi:hypothetical protein
VSADRAIRLPDILRDHETELLAEWIRQQQESAGHRRGLISDRDLEVQSRDLLGLLRSAAQSGGVDDIAQGAQWEPVRRLLGNVSRSRGERGFTPAETDALRQRQWFHEARQVFDYLNERGVGNEQGLGLDTLSMGTSADYPAAIAEGATIVRIGTAIFGPRNP